MVVHYFSQNLKLKKSDSFKRDSFLLISRVAHIVRESIWSWEKVFDREKKRKMPDSVKIEKISETEEKFSEPPELSYER